MSSDLTAYIVTQLENLGIEVLGENSFGSNLQAYCFKGHDSKTASLSIRKLDGAFYCFGCGIKGRDWNSLQQYLNIDPLDESKLPDPFETFSRQLEAEMDQENAIFSLPWDLEEWKGSWRKIPEKTLKRFQAYRWYDDFQRTYRILFPIYMYGGLRGWAARRLDEIEEMTWRNAPKMRSLEILYPLDIVMGMRPKTIVLVEGAYDALRLINAGIPALAIMGTKNFDPINIVAIVNTGAQRVVIAMDEDDSGEKARYEIAPVLQDTFDVDHFFCPEDEDPGSIGRSLVKKLKAML